MWERTVDEGTHRTSRGLRRVMARQRAYLIPGRAKRTEQPLRVGQRGLDEMPVYAGYVPGG
ncbi:MAG: hypothetical protein JWN27_452 [Candidatus Eremiobacteraeota bacterium]|nr:hypothetical protein [Candidatus Eremiobacteraeota bacterium]